MFGNLSKSLVKVPNHFNINIDTEQKNNIRKSYEKIFNTNNKMKKLNFYKTNKRPHYFKERDFIKKNVHLDLNYNNNYRKNSNHIQQRLSSSFEDFIFGNNNNDNISNSTSERKFVFNSKFKTATGTNNSTSTKKEFIFSRNSLNSRDSKEMVVNHYKLDNENFSGNLNNNIDNLIKKINGNSEFNFNVFKQKRGFGSTTRKNRIEILKEFLNRDQIVQPPVKLKFPKLIIKSNEKLYRDTLDKKLNSLSLISPKAKEQLKTKYRYFTSQKEFYRFSNSYFNNKKNPLTETVKCLEDNENKNKKK